MSVFAASGQEEARAVTGGQGSGVISKLSIMRAHKRTPTRIHR